jgi:hypothetical protein
MDRARAENAAPAAQTGADAFARAERSGRMQMASKVVQADEISVPASVAGRTTTARSVGGRIFVMRDGSWTDLRYDPSLRVVRIAPFGTAYFELAERLPALKPYLALAERVRIAGDDIVLEVTPDGRNDLDRSDLRAVLEAFDSAR